MAYLHGSAGGEEVHAPEVVEVEDGRSDVQLGEKEVKEVVGVEHDVSVDDGQQTVLQRIGDDLVAIILVVIATTVAEVLHDRIQHLFGVDLLNIVLGNQGYLERQGRYLQVDALLPRSRVLVYLIRVLQELALSVELDDRRRERIQLRLDQTQQQVLLQNVD